MAYQFSRKSCFKCGNRQCCYLFFYSMNSTPKIVGHIAENCSSEQRLCYNCRQPGHESSACPSPRTVSAKQCYFCRGVGHIQGISLFPNVQMSPAHVHSGMSYFEGPARGQPEMLRKDSLSTEDITQFTRAFRLVDTLVILLAIVKMAELAMVVSLLVHLLQVVHSTLRLYHPSSAIVVEVPIILPGMSEIQN